MKRRMCIVCVLALLLSVFSGCAGGQDELYSQALGEPGSALEEPAGSPAAGSGSPESSVPEGAGAGDREAERYDPAVNYLPEPPGGSGLFQTEPNTELRGTLTVSTSVSGEALPLWIEAFEAAYPHVDVVLKSSFDSLAAAARAEEAGGGLKAAGEQMTVDLFAGAAGDVVGLNTAPYQRFAESGLFQDLYGFMDSDPGFQKEDYYANVFGGWETADGRLAVIGPSVYPSCVVFNKLVLDEMGIDLKREYPEGLNYREIADLYGRAKASGAMPEDAVLGKYFGSTSFDPFETLNYFDEQHSECRFDDPGYVEYLETMKGITDGLVGYRASFDPFSDRSDLIQVNSIMLETLEELTGKGDGENKVFQTYRLREGGALFRGTEIYGIPASCKNPELAWEFLKFMVSEKDFPERLNLYGDYDRVYRDLYSSCLPIHRKNLQKLCAAYYGDNAVFQAADSVMAPLSVQEFREEELYLALFDIYRDYYEYGLTDARECARLLQERAWLYLNE